MLEKTPRDPWHTDTADPARAFCQMFPPAALRADWRLFAHPDDFRRIWAPRKTALQVAAEQALEVQAQRISASPVMRALRGEVDRPRLVHA